MLMVKRELFFALERVWGIISIIFLSLILASKYVDENYFSILPLCASKINGSSCILCGMTRAFAKISDFSFREALALNKGSITLYVFMLLTIIIFFIYLIIKQLIQTKKNKL